MSDSMLFTINAEGVAEAYDDTWDITIHCTSKEEHERVVEMMNKKTESEWIPADQPPKPDEYVLLSFANFSIPLVGMYRDDGDGGAYYVGDDEESCISHNIIVNAWMPLPEPYRPDKCHGCFGAANNDCERCMDGNEK